METNQRDSLFLSVTCSSSSDHWRAVEPHQLHAHWRCWHYEVFRSLIKLVQTKRDMKVLTFFYFQVFISFVNVRLFCNSHFIKNQSLPIILRCLPVICTGLGVIAANHVRGHNCGVISHCSISSDSFCAFVAIIMLNLTIVLCVFSEDSIRAARLT